MIEELIREILFRHETIKMIDKKMVNNKNNLRELCFRKILEALWVLDDLNVKDPRVTNLSISF